MTMVWHDLAAADDAVFDSPGTRVYRFSRRLTVEHATIWAALTADASIGAWRMPPGLAIRSRWTSRRPFGIGTTREVTLPTNLILRERFYRWDDGTRHAFFATAANRPGLRRFAEDYTVTPERDGASTFSWTVAVEPSPVGPRGLRPAIVLNRAALAMTFSAAVRTLQRRSGESRPRAKRRQPPPWTPTSPASWPDDSPLHERADPSACPLRGQLAGVGQPPSAPTSMSVLFGGAGASGAYHERWGFETFQPPQSRPQQAHAPGPGGRLPAVHRTKAVRAASLVLTTPINHGNNTKGPHDDPTAPAGRLASTPRPAGCLP
jgi:uncharacterized protein YndB with AHSA1/START domain